MTFLYGSPVQEGTRDWGLLANYTSPMGPMGIVHMICMHVKTKLPPDFVPLAFGSVFLGNLWIVTLLIRLFVYDMDNQISWMFDFNFLLKSL